MPRDIPVANGTLLVTFDKDYRIRDIYYPNIGHENHTEGAPFRFGIWADHQFSWVGRQEWDLDMDYLDDTLVTHVRMRNARLGLELVSNDCVDFHENVFLRKIVVKNLWPQAREVRLYFHHDFNISESDVGNTALYDPAVRGLLHYKGPRYFLISTWAQDIGMDQYATGIKGIHGAQGTWKDAEDGHLEGHPVAQGSVDSTIGIHLSLPASGESTLHYWMIVANTYRDMVQLNEVVLQKGPQSLIDRTAAYWKLWIDIIGPNLDPLPKDIAKLYKRSLLILRTQIDNNGAIVAANDSDIMQFARDTYSYVWPRDGAMVAYALDKAGYMEVSKSFYGFCRNFINKEGFLLHKYNPDGTPASTWHPWVDEGARQLAIQEDETALVIWALWHHYYKFCDTEFIKPLYRPLIIRSADFMVSYRDPRTGLPRPSHDLWEERRGIITFTVAAVYAGLLAASRFAQAFGETNKAETYRRACAEIKAGMDKYLYQEKLKRFARMIIPRGDNFEVDLTVDSSLYGVFAFGVYAPDDEKVVHTMNAIKERLWVKTDIGGIARYVGDYYHRVSDTVPGNPWFICTLWLAQYYIARAKTLQELDDAMPILTWVASRALKSGVLAEQVNPFTNEPISVSPLTWSHATFVTTVIEYLEKLEELKTCDRCGGPLYWFRRQRS